MISSNWIFDAVFKAGCQLSSLGRINKYKLLTLPEMIWLSCPVILITLAIGKFY